MLRKTARCAEYNEVTSTSRYGQPGKPQCTCLAYKVWPKSVKIVLHTSKSTFQETFCQKETKTQRRPSSLTDYCVLTAIFSVFHYNVLSNALKTHITVSDL